MNLVSAFLETAARSGTKTAIISGPGERISFADLARRSGQLAHYWQTAGIGKGDRVLIAMPVGIDLYAAIAGLWRLGATIVFPEPAMGLTGLRHAVEMTKPRAFLGTGAYQLLRLAVPALWHVPLHLGMAEVNVAADPVLDVDGSHPALISFTSGSTGKPKGIVRTHAFLAAQNACVAELLAPSRDDEADLVAFPVFVIANLGQNITSILPNWKLRRQDRASATSIADQVAKHGVTRALLPPSICETLARSETDLGLDAIFTGGGPVFPDLLERLMRRSPTTSLTTVYGSTEAEPIAHQRAQDISQKQWEAMKHGQGLLVGRPVAQTMVRIEKNEILVTGDHVNKSYLDGRGYDDNKRHILSEIWHRTGDAGMRDAKGFLWLLGRHSARAGSLYPFQIEIAARNWPGVRQAALIPGTNPPVIALEGREPANQVWQEKADAISDARVIKVKRVGMDRRHRSKVDYARMQTLVDRHR